MGGGTRPGPWCDATWHGRFGTRPKRGGRCTFKRGAPIARDDILEAYLQDFLVKSGLLREHLELPAVRVLVELEVGLHDPQLVVLEGGPGPLGLALAAGIKSRREPRCAAAFHVPIDCSKVLHLPLLPAPPLLQHGLVVVVIGKVSSGNWPRPAGQRRGKFPTTASAARREPSLVIVSRGMMRRVPWSRRETREQLFLIPHQRRRR